MQTQKRLYSNQFKKLLIGWLVILVSYVLIRVLFVMFGINSKLALGSCLAIIPYLLGACYFGKACRFKSTWFYTLGILLPTVVEKIVLYLMGSLFYNISPEKITSVLKMIANHEPYLKVLTHPSAHYFIDISFLSLLYVLISLLISVLVIIFLAFNSKRKMQNECILVK